MLDNVPYTLNAGARISARIATGWTRHARKKATKATARYEPSAPIISGFGPSTSDTARWISWR